MKFFTKYGNALFLIVVIFLPCNRVSVFANQLLTKSTDVIIIGAGPGGLTLANFLEKFGIDYILIEKNSDVSPLSKATGIHVNSMKILKELGLAKPILRDAIRLDENIIVINGISIKTIHFSHGKKAYEKNISISQQYLEKILLANLEQGKIFYDNELIFFYKTEDDNIITIIINNKTKELTTIKSRFLVGCDGGSSTVRRILGINFIGITNPEIAVSFDAKINTVLKSHAMYMIGNGDRRFVFVPISNDGFYKISGKYDGPLDIQSLKKIVYTVSNIAVLESSIDGIVKYYKHSRIAEKFSCDNRIFLIGDAAHIFFPEGGYGLNLAIEDAYLLAKELLSFFQSNKDTGLVDFAKSRREFATLVQEQVLKMKSISENNNINSDIIENQVYQNHTISQ